MLQYFRLQVGPDDRYLIDLLIIRHEFLDEVFLLDHLTSPENLYIPLLG